MSSPRNIEKRGGVWYLRWRVPKRYHGVEKRREINVSLKTDSEKEATHLASVVRAGLTAKWDAKLAQGAEAPSRESFQKILALGHSKGLSFSTVGQLESGPIEELLERLEAVTGEPSNSPLVSVALGGVDLPRVKVSEMPSRMERVLSEDIGGKNARQLREWNNKWRRAAEKFIACAGDRAIPEITVAHARKYQTYWSDTRQSESLTTDYVNKEISRMRAIVDAYFKEIDVKNYENPFSGLSLEATGAERRSKKLVTRELPVNWIPNVLLDFELLAGLNEQARDIAIISAETGTRATEVYDLPAEHIFLDAQIPHFFISVEEKGEQQRQLKNAWSIRRVPLIGHALEAFARHPTGFPRYRGKATYSGAINKFLREKKLFPGPGHTIKGLRHTFETRLRRAGVENEERAQLMGHSLRQVRGREVYGDETDLRLRALYLELIAFPTNTWAPREQADVRRAIETLLKEEGFRPK